MEKLLSIVVAIKNQETHALYRDNCNRDSGVLACQVGDWLVTCMSRDASSIPSQRLGSTWLCSIKIHNTTCFLQDIDPERVHQTLKGRFKFV